MICSPRGGVSEPVKVHYPIPASIADRAIIPTRPQVEPLSVRDALTMPPKEISDRLVYTFFEIIHPPYPTCLFGAVQTGQSIAYALARDVPCDVHSL
ncbi:hypothetical protein LB505_012969 [Fusarium chuoi]|nr:hypothetical protein LB505_012969 [Fusarium chuoi]